MENEYYGIASTPMDDYLAHYGVRGMKWGVRKAVASGNSARLGRQYAKAQKKLAKLEKRANSGAKYARRAAALGAGAAIAGGAAVLGNKSNLTNGIYNVAGRLGKFKTGAHLANRVNSAATTNAWDAAKNAAYTIGGKTGKFKQGAQAARSIDKARANVQSAIYDAAGKTGKFKQGAQAARSVNNLSVGRVARIGAGALGVGLGAAAGYNAYRAATTKRAAKKAAQFRSETNKAFAGTQYANGGSSSKKRRRR